MSTISKVQSILRVIFNRSDLVITEFTTAADVAGWDSLNHVSIIFKVEEEFGIHFEMDDLFEMDNIGALVKIIDEKRGHTCL